MKINLVILVKENFCNRGRYDKSSLRGEALGTLHKSLHDGKVAELVADMSFVTLQLFQGHKRCDSVFLCG